MPKYSITNKAKEDLDNIYLFTIQNWSAKQADKYIKNLQQQFTFLSNNPQIGKSYEMYNIPYRGFPIESHLIIYSIKTNSQILILRVLHKSMDLETNL